MQLFSYLLTLACTASFFTPTSSSIIFEAVTLDWEWPNDTIRDTYIRNGDFIPEYATLSAIQTSQNGEIFVTVPRVLSKKGIPAALNTLILDGPNSVSGKLRPYPSLEMNKIGDCNALQQPISVSYDPRHGHLYVLDSGRVGTVSTLELPSNLCPAKIVVFDTLGGDTVIRKHELPDSIAPYTSNFVNDIVLDYVDPDHPTEVKYAYITETLLSKLIVFDFSTNTSWSYSDPSMLPITDGHNMTINGVEYNFVFGINGIAMSPTFNYVYFSNIGSAKLWQIPTWVLRRRDRDFAANVRMVGYKKSMSDAMHGGHRGIYYGAVEDNAVCRWDLEKDILEQGVSEGEVLLKSETILAQNWDTIQFPDGIALDSSQPGSDFLYFNTGRAQLLLTGTIDHSGASGPNTRTFKIPINDTDYLVMGRRFPHVGIIG